MPSLPKIEKADLMSQTTVHAKGSVARTLLEPGFFDTRSQCRVLVATPVGNPDLWSAYLAGAHRNYEAYGVLDALEYDRIKDGSTTSLFFAVVTRSGEMVGGARCQGPYVFAHQAHAVEEWDGCEGQDAVVRSIQEHLAEGVVECKTGWVAADAKNRGAISDVISRCMLHATALWNVRYALGTGADHVLPLWRKSGGVPDDDIPAAAYPTERYRTKLVWWDRYTFADDAEHGQVIAALTEWMELAETTGLPTERFSAESVGLGS